MKVLRYGLAAVAAAAMLTLTACAPAEPALPPSISQPSDITPPPSATPSATPTDPEPVAPSTSVISSSGVQSNGLPQYPALEEQALVYTGVKKESPTVIPKQETAVTPVEKVTAAGGAAPTGDYVLNLTYKLCAAAQMYRDQGLDLNSALVKASSEVPAWVGFTAPQDAALASAYMDVVMTSYSYICVPLFDERARADLENGVYQG